MALKKGLFLLNNALKKISNELNILLKVLFTQFIFLNLRL